MHTKLPMFLFTLNCSSKSRNVKERVYKSGITKKTERTQGPRELGEEIEQEM